jgi:glutamate N-acetyltransferase/amino-acid N-acetyltransferase
MTSVGGGPDHPVVIAPLHSRFLSFPSDLVLEEPDGQSPGVTYPEGFLAGGIAAGLKESGRPDIGVLAVGAPWQKRASSAAVFTTNAFAAAPVVLDREECDLGRLVALVINSGNANACTGKGGMEVARGMQQAVATALGLNAVNVAVGSTGIIGVQLDRERLSRAAGEAAQTIVVDGGMRFNQSIMTTDRFPKMCAGSVNTSAGVVRLGACAKGAGMISPAMATMLCTVTTDAELTPEQADGLLKEAVARSFNRVSVDGEMSTNDSVFLLASGASGVRADGVVLAEIGASLNAILMRIALMVVADGEGATKIMRLRVVGSDTEGEANAVARAIADSALVKTAMHGGDPNWGRIVSSAGAALAGRTLPRASLELCGVTVMEDGVVRPLTARDRRHLSAQIKLPEVDIRLDLGLGTASTEVFFADLGHEYVTINAEYHS